MSYYHDFKKAGIIHKIIQSKLQEYLKLGLSSLEIVEFIENNIKLLSKKTELNSGLGFPVGININDVAAHFTPSINDNPIIQNNDVVKIDFGVHINGCISDGAFSWCPSGKYNKLIEIAKEATTSAIKYSGPDAILGEIGSHIEEIIESYEIIIDNKLYQVNSITDLSGHNIQPYRIHAGKFVPNGKCYYFDRMKENEIFAIETFPTLGNKKIKNSDIINHFMINKYDDSISKLYEQFNTLPFCPRWTTENIPDCKFITKFPVLMNNGITAQYEKNIYIKDNGIEILN
jgi:methionyl aminopeptidase